MDNHSISSEQFLSGGGEMGALIRSMDWSDNPLGPVETWPQSLRTSVSLCLSSTFPILIAWGPETIQIYNDAYRPICGSMHPQSMGMNFRICWESALEVVGDKFTRGQQGEGTYITDQQMFLFRYGYLEEAFMTFSFAPIRDESGEVGGIFHPITETTDKMLNARRTQVLREMAAVLAKAKSIEDIGSLVAEKQPDFVADLPFLLFYSVAADGASAGLVSAAGTALAPALTIPEILLDGSDQSWPLAAASSSALVLDDLALRFGDFSCQPYPETPHTAVILPVFISGKATPFGYIVAGVSSRRAIDEDYLGFYSLLANTFSSAVSNVYAYEQEQKRAEALAAIDRSKTAFFSNVSHEFRTPLTLMLGQLEDLQHKAIMSDPEISEIVLSSHRNSMRLLKLVNNLLDFSRVEAGRVKAAFQPVDIVEVTADLASSFRSIIEKAGMELVVETPQAELEVFLDIQMWEKIVLNLLSNAFKYTLKGKIMVELLHEERHVVLKVSDTGVGIPESELPHMFERFHRVENAIGRTHEGSGKNTKYLGEMLKRSNDAGVVNHLIMVDDEGDLAGTNEKVRLKAVDDHRKWLDAAKFLQCRSVRVNLHGEGNSDDKKTASIDSLGRLGDMAGNLNLNVVVENHGSDSSKGFWIADIMKQVNKPNVGTLPDFGNFCITHPWGTTQDGCNDEYDRYKGVEEMLPFAKGVSAKTYDFDANGEQPLIDYKRMLDIVKASGFKGYIGVEFEGNTQPEEEGIRKTKTLVEKYI